jgi:DnaJ-domain-containing protein 1
MLGPGKHVSEPEKTLDRLKEQLLSGGSRPSIAPRPWSKDSERPEAEAAYQRIRPFAEAMYLVMSADGSLDERELHTLRGALRSLTNSALGTGAMEAMLAEFERLLSRDGLDLRLDAVAARLYPEREDRELALALAATVAISDDHHSAPERQTIVSLAERLGIGRQRLEALLSGAGD